MYVDVRVDIDEDGPVVVKSAAGRAAGRLRHEHQRLTRAVHPGVVALARQPDPAHADTAPAADHATSRHPGLGDAGDPDQDDDTDCYVLHTRYAGEPVSRWTGTVAGIAGLGAAVAGTLADLHRLDIVHGRVDGSHILIGDDSRPRLCGLSHPGGATPADDVAALGAVLGALLERAPVSRWRRPRGSAGAARALRQVIERVSDPVPTRRPSAAAFADAILDAVPGAELPAPSGPAGAGTPDPHRGRPGKRSPSGGAPEVIPPEGALPGGAPPPRQDTLDRIWSYAGEQSDDERWAAAFGSGPRDLPVGGVPSSAPTGTPGRGEPAADDPLGAEAPPSLPMARLDTPGWSTTTGDDPTSPGDRRRPTRVAGSRDRPVDRDLADDTWGEAHDTRDHDLALGHRGRPTHRHSEGRSEDGRHDDGPPEHGPPEHGPPEHGPHDDGWDEHRRHDHGWSADDRSDPGDDGRAGEVDDLLTRDHRVPVPRVARPRPDDAAPDPPDRARRVVVVATLVVATGLAAAGAVMVSAQGGEGDGGGDPGSNATTPANCPPAAAPVADVDGDGCAEGLVVDGSTVDAGVARWTLGEPGDLVTVGDWDCDGEASAALLRPTTGDVFVFAAWAPADEPVTVSSSQQVDGGIGIRAQPADGGGCDQLLIDRADGTAATVEVPR